MHGAVVYSLRSVECTSDIIDQISEWTASTIGASYGKVYELPLLAKWMKMIPERIHMLIVQFITWTICCCHAGKNVTRQT